jgi:hypothetical protein
LLRRVGLELAAFAANCALFVVALVVGFRVVYPLLFAVLRRVGVEPGSRAPLSEHQVIVLSLSTAIAGFAVLARRWTRHVLNVAVAGGLLFLGGMISLGQAMYLADQGDPTPLWAYIQPRSAEYLGALWCAAASALGWYLGGRFWKGAGSPPT